MIENSTSYKEAGVDIEAADTFIQRIKPFVKKTESSQVLSSIGHYAGLFSLKRGRYRDPVLCASTDGVGTKLKLAIQYRSLEGLGQDLVAMSANDILCLGAEPLFFLDYYATGHLEPEVGLKILKGIADSCREIGCALLGGETAEMPSIYQEGDFDLAGFIVGVVEKKKIIDGRSIRPGDLLLGLASSGPHSNGFSLIRKIVQDQNLTLDQTYPSLKEPLGTALLKPTRLYGNSVLKVLKKYSIHGMAHITGGGFQNIGRILPKKFQARIEKKSWPLPPLFTLLKKWGGISDAEMEEVFNCGIGFVLIVPEKQADHIAKELKKMGEVVWKIGVIEKLTSERNVVLT